MQKILINGGKQLSGTITISGAKNSAVALLPAAILCDEPTTIYNVPNISDKNNLINILNYLNVKTTENHQTITINPKYLKNKIIDEVYSSKLRASYYFMGALLGREKKVEISFPGGCEIGQRKIDLHLKGFQLLGAKVTETSDKYIITASKLKGADIYLDIASVGATINIMLAATKAKGITRIYNAAKEPEIVNVESFLNNMGAKISGAGTSLITIEGVDYLHKAMIEVIPDRIEAGTYLIMGALLGDNLVIDNIIEEHLNALLSKMKEIGINIKKKPHQIRISAQHNYHPINITTLPYPGFPTDLAQPMSVLLTQCIGTSILDETLYSNRMGHVKYLNNMGANITVSKQTAIITGKTKLEGQEVKASDLRAGATLIIAGLLAEGQTKISNIFHILRGYENIVEKLVNVGADIKIIEED